ncbi:hypothetical protein F5883DRAFT_588390 [Diaporthe sp. PMI_573]|nr:hypothetical protein F5883DRAFT_590490 [Diaporthaceae sp. PMI_573]KAH8744999.1 hypothetical protein F5883DRAFT_588390 [Diaporthaceae sp. PMI_573]
MRVEVWLTLMSKSIWSAVSTTLVKRSCAVSHTSDPRLRKKGNLDFASPKPQRDGKTTGNSGNAGAKVYERISRSCRSLHGTG